MSDSVRPHRRQPTRLPRPRDSPGKNTRVGCHLLLQCMEVKSESEVAQSCPTLSDPMDCSPPGSPIPGILQAGVLEWGAITFSKLPYDPAIPLLGVYSKAMEPKPQRDICTPTLTAASSTTAEAQKPPECLSTGGCTKQLRYEHIVEYYSAITKGIRDTLRQYIWNHK